MTRTLLALATALLSTALPVAAQGGARCSVLRDLGAGRQGLRVLDPSAQTAPVDPVELQGITLLPFGVNARTQLTRFLPSSARLVEDVPGAARALLPRAQGCLYRFSRPDSSGTLRFGFFVVGPDGRPRIVAEESGTGSAADQDPWQPNVALSGDGKRMLAATRPQAGGDLLEIDLVQGGARSLTAGAGPLAFAPESLVLNPHLGAAATARGWWRFVPGDPAGAQPVPFPAATPAWFARELVLAADGPHALGVAGDGPGAARVWTFGTSGAARATEGAPTTISRAGYLPDFVHGPFLALSDDGSRVAWRTEGALTREAFVSEVVAPAAPLHVTSDALYLDTLDEIGQFRFIPFSARLLVSVGKSAAVTGIEDLDVYAVDLGAGGTAVLANLSGTSGDLLAPFQQPSSLKPEEFVLDPTGRYVVVLDRSSGGTGALRSLELASGTLSALLPGARGIDDLTWLGSDLVASLRIEAQADRRQLWLFPQGSAAQAWMLQDAPDVMRLVRLTTEADQLAWLELLPSLEGFAWRWARGEAAPTRLTARTLAFASPLDFAQEGTLCLGAGKLGQPGPVVSWPALGGALRLAVGGGAIVLPGS